MTNQLTSEEAKHLRIIREYTALITSEENVLGLCGYQPTLTKVRTAYQAGEITDSDLSLVLNNLAISLKGESEAFANQAQCLEHMFGDMKPDAKLSPVVLSTIEQCTAIQDIMGEDLKKKSYSGPRRKAKKKEEAINVSALPAHLRYLV